MPIDYKKYPDNWKLLRHKVLERAGNHCELCFVKNGIYGYRNIHGRFVYLSNLKKTAESIVIKDELYHVKKVLRIILTIHHIDYDINNNEMDNLIALCQRCHNKLDAPLRKKNRRKTYARKKR